MEFENAIKRKTLYTVEEFDDGSFQIHKESSDYTQDKPNNKWINLEDLGECAWNYCLPFLKDWRSFSITPVYPMSIKLFIKRVFEWQFEEAENNKDMKLAFRQAFACFGKTEIEKRLKVLG